MRLVIALGGNALLRRGEAPTAEAQRRHAAEAVSGLAEIVQKHRTVITHGNGPQVGLLALQTSSCPEFGPYPLDVLGAESEGMIGYLLEQGLRSRLPDLEIATVLTQVVVDAEDPAFGQATKPIGPIYTPEEGRRLAAERGWTMAAEGIHLRRVVPSPEPLRIIELKAIRLLTDAGIVVICAGGGGVPVVPIPSGGYRGVEAVVDKDSSAALLACELGADGLVMLTDVDAVYLNWGTPMTRPIHLAEPSELRSISLPPGSMGPKVEAACRFVERTGGWAAIGALAQGSEVVAGRSGTRVELSRGPSS